MTPSLSSARVAVVSGKGGTGKTTVACALAKAAAAQGHRTLLLEVEGRNSIAPLFDEVTIGWPERPLGPNLMAEAVVPDEALIEYLYLFYGIKRIGRALVNTKAIDFATNIAPGLRDILLIGKVKEAERRRVKESYAYDLVVLDAPPTGRLPRFLDAPRAVADLVHGGPIRTQAQGVLDMITDPSRLHVILVTLPEEMPALETTETITSLEHMGVSVGPVVVNRVTPGRFSRDEEHALTTDASATVRAAAERAGTKLDAHTIASLADVAGADARRARNQRTVVNRLSKHAGRPIVTLPALFSPAIRMAELDELGAALIKQGAVT